MILFQLLACSMHFYPYLLFEKELDERAVVKSDCSVTEQKKVLQDIAYLQGEISANYLKTILKVDIYPEKISILPLSDLLTSCLRKTDPSRLTDLWQKKVLWSKGKLSLTALRWKIVSDAQVNSSLSKDKTSRDNHLREATLSLPAAKVFVSNYPWQCHFDRTFYLTSAEKNIALFWEADDYLFKEKKGERGEVLQELERVSKTVEGEIDPAFHLSSGYISASGEDRIAQAVEITAEQKAEYKKDEKQQDDAEKIVDNKSYLFYDRQLAARDIVGSAQCLPSSTPERGQWECSRIAELSYCKVHGKKKKGEAIVQGDCLPFNIVHSGGVVNVEIAKNNVYLRTEATALQAGKWHEFIRVKRGDKIMQAQVIDFNKAVILL